MITIEDIKSHCMPNSTLVFAEDMNIKGISKYVNVSKSYWYKGVKSGKFPSPSIKESPRKTYWNIDKVVKFLKSNPKLIKNPEENALMQIRGDDWSDIWQNKEQQVKDSK